MAKTAELRAETFDHFPMTASHTAMAADAPVIDLVHLSRQTLGDEGLERELLSLFERQAAQFADRLSAPMSPSDRRWRAELAHTLKGSARAIGAFPVADAAERYEATLHDGADAADALWPELYEAISASRAAIARLLGRN